MERGEFGDMNAATLRGTELLNENATRCRGRTWIDSILILPINRPMERFSVTVIPLPNWEQQVSPYHLDYSSDVALPKLCFFYTLVCMHIIKTLFAFFLPGSCQTGYPAQMPMLNPAKGLSQIRGRKSWARPVRQ
jgi:hypothetical protein